MEKPEWGVEDIISAYVDGIINPGELSKALLEMIGEQGADQILGNIEESYAQEVYDLVAWLPADDDDWLSFIFPAAMLFGSREDEMGAREEERKRLKAGARAVRAYLQRRSD